MTKMDISNNISDLAKTIRDAVVEAGRLALSHYERGFEVYSKGDGSPLTDADLRVDEFLYDRLIGAFPSYGWLSEERKPDGSHLTHRRCFVVDPIDGTRGFIKKIPEWSISVGVIEHGQPLIGVIYNPMADKIYLAIKGQGASLNGAKLAVRSHKIDGGDSGTKAIDTAFADNVGDNAGGGFLRLSTIGNALASLLEDYNIIRVERLASLAYQLAQISEGALDVVIVRKGINGWDIVAADLLLRETGYSLEQLENQKPLDYSSREMVYGVLIAAAPGLAKRIATTINKGLAVNS